MCDINFLLTHYEEDTQYIFSVLNAKESMKIGIESEIRASGDTEKN